MCQLFFYLNDCIHYQKRIIKFELFIEIATAEFK